MNRLYLLAIFFYVVFNANAQQENESKSPFSKSYIGFGVGLDFGGIGGRITLNPIPALGLFGGAGYAFSGIGYNIGTICYLLPKNRVSPTIGVMYGYNAAIKIKGGSSYDKLYYGTSISAGVQARFRKKENNFFSANLIIPFRSHDFFTDYDNLKGNVESLETPPSVLISLGFHFGG